MLILSSIQVGAKLLAAALRDPAPIVNLSTFWDFMKIAEAYGNQLTDAEKANPLYLDHVACSERIYQLRNDTRTIGNDQVQLGDQLIEAMAAYADQVANLFLLLLYREDARYQASICQEFDEVLNRVVRDIEEVPGGSAVEAALATFWTWRNRERASKFSLQASSLFEQQRYATELLQRSTTPS